MYARAERTSRSRFFAGSVPFVEDRLPSALATVEPVTVAADESFLMIDIAQCRHHLPCLSVQLLELESESTQRDAG